MGFHYSLSLSMDQQYFVFPRDSSSFLYLHHIRDAQHGQAFAGH